MGARKAVLQVVFSGALLASGCSDRHPASGEPSGGSWKPVLLVSPDFLRLPPPPAPGTPARQKELEELVALQAQRTAESHAEIARWDGAAVVRWNEIARQLVAKHRTSHPMASRVYALLGVAQYDALLAAWNNKYHYGRPRPAAESRDLAPSVRVPQEPAYPCEHAVVAAVSASVLAYLFPGERDYLEARAAAHAGSRPAAGAVARSDVSAGDSLGRGVAALVIGHARSDGSDSMLTASIQAGQGGWRSSPNSAPILPAWGRVKPWLMPSTIEFRPGPPPAPGSEAFDSALVEVKRYSRDRTSEQARIAALWADGPGSYAPAGRWNKIAADLVVNGGLSEIRAARVFALLNMALMDAGVACWDAKFHYGFIRPSQADPAITTPVGLPNFPSYTSAHSAFSGAGAEVLGYLFPAQGDSLRRKGEEASMSRLYGGIHYRFDMDSGLQQGRKVARLAIERGKSDGSP